jgi:hypothetical protein
MGYHWRAPLLSTLLLGAAWPGEARATCDPTRKTDRTQETTRIKQCLQHYSRAPAADEGKIYTFAHKDKLASMQSMSIGDFCAFEKARLKRGEELIFRHQIKNRDDFIGKAGFIAEAKKLDAALPDLEEVKKKKDAEGNNDVSGHKMRDLLTAVAFNKIYPGFLDRYTNDIVTEYNAVKGIVSPNAEEKGLILAYALKVKGTSVTIKSTDRPSTTAGLGVYVMNDPVTYLEHFYDKDHRGVVCSTAGKRIVDLTDTSTAEKLRLAGILRPNVQDLIYDPTSYNLWIAPTELEEAARGFLVRFDSQGRKPYADKCAIDYSSNACHEMTIDDFSDCNHFTRLLARLQTAQHFLGYLQGRSGNFTERFFAIWKTCATADTSPGCATIHSGLLQGGKITDGFRNLLLGTATKASFKEVLEACGCDTKGGGWTSLKFSCGVTADSWFSSCHKKFVDPTDEASVAKYLECLAAHPPK